MAQRYITLGFLLFNTYLLANDYSFLNPDLFVQEKRVWHFEADYAQVGSAKITTGDVFGSKLNYGEGNSSLYFSHFLNKENSLSWQAGVNYVNLDWDENPAFTKKQYPYGIGSLTWISHSVDKWRWLITGGVTVDATTFNFGKSAVYYSTLWGRYQQTDHLGIHLGFFAYYGAKNGYLLPILGIDWWMSPKWELKAVFPIDVSINYHFVKNWVTSILATSLGGPYRFPRKMHGGIGEFHDGIFKVYSTVLEWDLKFVQKNLLQIGAGAGWNFGGWMQMSTENNHHKKYYDFNGAAYARLFATVTF